MLTLPEELKGAFVFPIVPGGKLPATRNGWRDATNDPAKIAEWEAINPKFNWALATGLSGLFVVDVDPNGLDWWAKLLERDPVIKAAVDRAFQVRTPRGGLHIYFRGEGPSTASRISDGIDTRGGIQRDGKIVSGGYVLLPGSATDKGNYHTLPGGTIAELPTAIAAIIPQRQKTDTVGLTKNPDKDLPRNVKTAMDLIGKFVADGKVSVEGQGGNTQAFKVACAILDKGISPALTFELLWDHWNPACSPPWADDELEIIVGNAARHGEDTESGAKGHQSNADAFAAFAGLEFEPPKGDRVRDKLQWIHDYADNVRDPEWLIPGIIPASGTGMIYGESGSFKSFVALDMALCLAFGVPGQWGAPPVKHDVLFLAGEGSIATARKRWPAWMEWQGLEFRSDHRMIVKDRVPFYTDVDAWEHIKEDLAALGAKPQLIVIDTLTRLLTGMDENATKDATLITGFLEDLARYFECFVLAIHHTGKDQSKGARGSSAFYANMDAVIAMRKLGDGTEFRVKKQKDADVSDEIKFLKIREFGSSIILEQSNEAPPEEKTGKGKARYDWATSKEVLATLVKMGGATSTQYLAQTISSAYDVEIDTVKKQLRSEELKFLHTGDDWKIPGTGEGEAAW